MLVPPLGVILTGWPFTAFSQGRFSKVLVTETAKDHFGFKEMVLQSDCVVSQAWYCAEPLTCPSSCIRYLFVPLFKTLFSCIFFWHRDLFEDHQQTLPS